MIWPHASKKNPCPICGGTDWCSFGQKSILCRRVESERPHFDRGGSLDGWYHFDGDAKPVGRITHPLPTTKIPQFNLHELESLKIDRLDALADSLNVATFALCELGVGYASKHRAWVFPMRGGDGGVIGARLRNDAGLKWTIPGSRSGLFIPAVPAADVFEMQYSDTLFLPEGPTDVAALRSIGLLAWGRPNCNSGIELILSLMKCHQWMQFIKRVVVVSDNDEIKTRPDGSQWRPGYDGARRLASAVRPPHAVWMTPSPHKDVRQFVKAGAGADLIMNMVNKKIWTR